MQLPESPKQHDLERASIRALEALLPEDKFLLREIGGGDYGSDRVVELRLDGGKRMSNIHFHVQIKATEKEPNADGRYSYALKVSTYNYLRNQPNSIVVLDLPSAQSFRWAWVEDVWRYATEAGVDFDTTTQESFTFPFSRTLDKAACLEIHARVFERAVLGRRLSETLTRATSISPPDILVQQGANVLDLGQLQEDIKTYGFGLVNIGRLDALDAMLDRLPGKARSDLTIRCIIAFARLSQGRYQEALAALPRANEVRESSAETRQLCAFVGATARKGLDQIDGDGLDRLMREANELAPDSATSILLQVHAARDSFLSARDPETSAAMLDAFRKACQRVREAWSNNSHMKLMISIMEWESRTIGISGKVMEASSARRMRDAIGVESDPLGQQAEIEQLEREYAELMAEAGSLEDRVRKQGSHFLEADLALSYARVHAQHLFVVQGLAVISKPIPEVDKAARAVSSNALLRVRRAGAILEHLRCLEYACRARLLEAELCDHVGDLAARDAAARKAHELAQDIDSVQLMEQTTALLSGRYPLRELEKALRDHRSEPDHDMDLASAEDRDSFTLDILRSLGVPRDRFAIARKVVEDDARAASERRSFCGFIELREEPQSRDPKTLYRRAPRRQAVCVLFGYRTRSPGDDGGRVLDDFKTAHCSSCPARRPTRRGSDA